MRTKGSYLVEDLEIAIANSLCFSDVCKLLNITVCSFNYDRIKKLCSEHNIKYDHFDVKRTFKRGKFEWSEETALCKNSPLSRSMLRPLLIRLGYYTGQCSICELSEWNNKPLTIEIDHIDGINDNNELTNLRWLCPNCHSQTETFRNSRARRSRKTE